MPLRHTRGNNYMQVYRWLSTLLFSPSSRSASLSACRSSRCTPATSWRRALHNYTYNKTKFNVYMYLHIYTNKGTTIMTGSRKQEHSHNGMTKKLLLYCQIFPFKHLSRHIISNWGEPERAPHSRDLHHFFVSYTRLTSVHPIAYNRISTWKTGILRTRRPDMVNCAAPSIRPAYVLTAQTAWILLAQSTSAVPQSMQAECARCCRDKYALKVRSSSDLPPQLHGWCIDVYMKMGAI